MQKIRILTDSASDIPFAKAEELNIRVLPIPITHEGKSYSERVEFTDEQFYELILNSKTLPTTSHITAYTYLEEYKKAYDEGYTELLNVTINSLGSNMFESSQLAKQMFYEEVGQDKMRIEVIDSRTYTVAYGVAIMKAADMAAEGKSIDEIIEYMNDWFDRLEILFSVYSLDVVKRSGRVNCASAFVGDLLGLRPFMVFVQGVATIIDKVRGDKNIVPRLVEIAQKRSRDADKYPMVVVRGTPIAEAEELAALAKVTFNRDSVEVYSIGACIALNSGPKVVAIIYAGESCKK
jgi:DegV family protein with EDD domain